MKLFKRSMIIKELIVVEGIHDLNKLNTRVVKRLDLSEELKKDNI